MSRMRAMASRLMAIFGRRDDDVDLEEELRLHVEMAEDENRRRGMTPQEARRAALREFGGVTQIRERFREQEGVVWIENLRRDAAYAVRQMRKAPGFAAVAAGTLALGIGAATAMFTVIDHLLLEPVRFRDADRVVSIRVGDQQHLYGATWTEAEAWHAESHSFEQVALAAAMRGRSYLQGKSELLEVSGERVSANLFPTLGVVPELGRGFLPEAFGSNAAVNAGTIVLSDGVWRNALQADRSILGRQVRLNNENYTVVGVMPAGFRFPARSGWAAGQVWVSLPRGDSARSADASPATYEAIARLSRGASTEPAAAELSVIQKRAAMMYADPNTREVRSSVVLQRYADTLVGADVRSALLRLLAAAGVLWLIASVNVTNLLLARSNAREREIAMRGALGATRWRIVQQMIVEGLVLSLAAAALGVGLSVASVKLFAHALSQRVRLPVPAMPDFRILTVLLALTIVSAVMSSAWPAWIAARNPIEPALRQGGPQAGTGRRHHRLRGALVAAEIAMSLTLLVGCGLLLRTIYGLRHVSLGYRTDHILVAHLSIPSYRFSGRNMTTDLYQPLLERVEHMHGVESAGLMTQAPLGNALVVGVELKLGNRSAVALFKTASPGVDRVFAMPMLAGRYFNDTDTPSSQPVVVVNEAFARAVVPDGADPESIVGQKLISTDPDVKMGTGVTVVGVMADARQWQVSDATQPEVQLCIPQMTPGNMFYQGMNGVAMDLTVRSPEAAAIMIPELRNALRQANPELANSTIATMEEIVEDSFGGQRLAARLLEIFGGAALLLCVAGLYGLLAYVVTQRTRELGVRIALGAQRGDLLWLVMRQAGTMLLAGLAAGTALALTESRIIRGFLFGVSAHDGWSLAGATAILLVSGLMAAYFPARRAASVDPMRALRAE
jgi:predicted permease